MRVGKWSICAKCGCEWSYESGIGYFNAIYHCNKCGKEKIVTLTDGDTPRIKPKRNGGVCDCGGIFSMKNDKRFCPNCHEQMPNNDLEEMLWD